VPRARNASADLNRSFTGAALVGTGAALFGTLGYLSRTAASFGVDALGFVLWRAAIGSLTLFAVAALLVAYRRGTLADLNPWSLSPSRRVALFTAALCGALLNVAMFAAFATTTIAVALICFYSYPAIVTVAAARLYHERLAPLRVAALLLSCVGLVLVVVAPLLSSSAVLVSPLGVGLALFAALCQATFILVSGRGFGSMPALNVSAWVILVAVVVTLPLALVVDTGAFAGPLVDPGAWPAVLAGGIAAAAVSTTLFVTGIGMIGPSRAAIMMTVEPLVGVSLAALLLGEQSTPLQLLGGAAVIVAAIILQVAPRAPVVAAVDAPAEQSFGPLV
jgi:drug/metabolite transporter, DME family